MWSSDWMVGCLDGYWVVVHLNTILMHLNTILMHLNTTAFSISTPPSHTDVCRQAGIATRLVEFFEFFKTQPSAHSMPLSVRDLLSWSDFVCRLAPTCGPLGAYVHGAFLCLLDGVGLGTGASTQVCVKGGFLTDYVYRWYMKGIVLCMQK